MVSAVATRIAPSTAEIRQAPSPHVPAEGRAGTAPATTAPNDAVVVDLSDQALAALAAARGDARKPGASAEDLAGLIRFEERFKLMNEYTALHQELAFISGKAAAHALDKTFEAGAVQGDGGGEEGEADIDRHLRRRDELMPRFAELTRMLGALPGQDG